MTGAGAAALTAAAVFMAPAAAAAPVDDPEEARADVRQIIEGAIDREYGEDVGKWADWLRETAQRWDLSRAVQDPRWTCPPT